ncbi:MAG: hypothetical protein LN413_00310 [Candidatus Thermoplasmatota archaeon]|nr:hypothetical protein [Candidatus Thermoplasmatota archaeon]
MPRDNAIITRQELEAHRRFLTGITETDPRIEALDERQPPSEAWVIDVFIGIPGDDENEPDNVLFSVPIALYAREHVTDEGQPVLLERSKQGKMTVIGRALQVPPGFAFEFGGIFEKNFHVQRLNYSKLRLGWLPDLDWVLEELQDLPDSPLQADPTEPVQTVKAFDAFGDQVFGPGVTSPPLKVQEMLQPEPKIETKARHRTIKAAKLGPFGDPDAMQFGISELQPTIRKSVISVVP